jgi:hypothetical protein
MFYPAEGLGRALTPLTDTIDGCARRRRRQEERRRRAAAMTKTPTWTCRLRTSSGNDVDAQDTQEPIRPHWTPEHPPRRGGMTSDSERSSAVVGFLSPLSCSRGTSSSRVSINSSDLNHSIPHRSRSNGRRNSRCSNVSNNIDLRSGSDEWRQGRRQRGDLRRQDPPAHLEMFVIVMLCVELAMPLALSQVRVG